MNPSTTVFPCVSHQAAFDSRLAFSLPKITLMGAADDGHKALASFVASEFAAHYHARVTHFMPWLMGLHCDNRLVGVAGLRPARGDRLFIEQYIDAPIENAIAPFSACKVVRNSIVEIGNLAGHYPGVTRSLFPLLTGLLHDTGYDWAVCNATRTVQNALRKLGMAFTGLVVADPDRLGTARATWGSYYAHETTVIAIDVAQAYQALQANPGILAGCHMALAGIDKKFPPCRCGFQA